MAIGRAIIFSLLVASSLQTIQIMHPKELKNSLANDGQIKSSLGNFGHIIYGSSLLGRLYYPVKNQLGCKPFQMSDLPEGFYEGDNDEEDKIDVIIVDRGNCSFVTKVRNIEKLGVKLAIIADNREEEAENLIMDDDGTGHSISIPSLIINKKDADKIKESILGKTQKVYLKASFDISHPDNRVEYEYWYSTILDINMQDFYDISVYQSALSDNALFTPRIYTYSCDYCSQSVKDENCIANGKYCPYLPKGDLSSQLEGITANQLIMESVRQRCLYDILINDANYNANFTIWFNYMLNYIDQCGTTNSYIQNCSLSVMKQLGINVKDVDICFERSIIKDNDGKEVDNVLLGEDRKWANRLGIVLHPSVTINNITFRGQLKGPDVFRAVCAGFYQQPDICKGDKVLKLVNEANIETILIKDHGMMRTIHIVAAILIVLAMNVFALYIYRKYQKKKVNQELQMQVNSAVSQYFKLSGQEANF